MRYLKQIKHIIAAALAVGSIALTSLPVQAQEQSYSLTIRDNKFEPAVLSVKAGVKFQLKVTNGTAKQVEFESYALGREKVISPGQSAVVYLGPLEPGIYDVFDDFNQSNTSTIIAK